MAKVPADISPAVEEWFWSKVEKTETCWLWKAGKTSAGYGNLRHEGKGWIQAHEAAWLLADQEVPDGLQLAILCETHGCVNPDHMELVTSKANTLRSDGPTAKNYRKTHCEHGHPLSGSNVYWEKGKRKCRACQRAKQLKQAAKWAGGQKRPKPDAATLAEQIKEHSFIDLGEFYGVSDAAIRNWAKKYGLTWKPHRRAKKLSPPSPS